MRRDVMYLGSLVAIAASIVEFGFVALLAVIGPAWALRRGSLRPVGTAPLLVIATGLVVPALLDALGGDCPREGMDYMGECNTLASMGLITLFGAVITLQVAVLTGACAVVLRAARIFFRWAKGRSRTRR